jgi:hypothetical protein
MEKRIEFYWDTQQGTTEGWAYRVHTPDLTGPSGAVDGLDDLVELLELADEEGWAISWDALPFWDEPELVHTDGVWSYDGTSRLMGTSVNDLQIVPRTDLGRD